MGAVSAIAMLLGLWGDPDISGRLRLSTGAEVDSNARRTTPLLGESETGDGCVRTTLDAHGQWKLLESGYTLRLEAAYILGLKQFFNLSDEDQMVHDLRFNTYGSWGEFLFGRLNGMARLNRLRDGGRNYGTLIGGGDLGLRLGDWQVSGWGRITTFDFESYHVFSYWGPQAGGQLVWQPHPDWSAYGNLSHWWRLYPEQSEREDGEWGLRLGIGYKGPFVGLVEYWGRFQRSTDPTEDTDRHRLTLTLTAVLPWRLTVGVFGALQFNVGQSRIDPNAQAEDDENQNALRVQIRRGILEHFFVEVRYSLFANQFNTASTDFFRHTLYGGLGLHTN